MGLEFKPVSNLTDHFPEELPLTEDKEEVLALVSTLGYFAKGSVRAIIL